MVKFDDIYELYEEEKRENRQIPKYYFDKNLQRFENFNKIVKKNYLTEEKYYYQHDIDLYKKILELGYIPFIDSYKVCLECMKQYLVQRNDESLTEKFHKLPDSKNIVGERLHFLDCHSKTLYEYDDFEMVEVTKIIKRWCRENDIEISEPECYQPLNIK